MQDPLWQQCLEQLENELPEQQFNTWIRPLHASENENTGAVLAAPAAILLCLRNTLRIQGSAKRPG